ncbi:hypothetical protein ACIRVK_14110 [Streptomyces sp. NPDC101152]|uniref:hypothetical protein n=1 Tax=Streptomyces sp. NPDC101152 TaxID=3366116 RepID=UPI003816872B
MSEYRVQYTVEARAAYDDLPPRAGPIWTGRFGSWPVTRFGSTRPRRWAPESICAGHTSPPD